MKYNLLYLRSRANIHIPKAKEILAMRTDFEMIRDLEKRFTPKNRGFISEKEVILIKETLEIENRDELSLRNLRNFTVLYMGKEDGDEDCKEAMAKMDKMSAITAVIDDRLWNIGAF